MKTIGLIGGISWHSTAVYYSTINQLVQQRLGGGNAAELILYSINHDDFKRLQAQNDWAQIEHMLTDIALKLESAGADFVMICSNTPHKVAEAILKKISIPFLHIAEVTASNIKQDGLQVVGLLGTKFTMEDTFFTDILSKSGIDVRIPDEDDRAYIHQSILNELSQGEFNTGTKQGYLKIIEKLASKGAQAVILGCTEIGMLLNQSDSRITLYDTTILHSRAAVDYSLKTDTHNEH